MSGTTSTTDERSITFSANEICQIVNGTKTLTRRPVLVGRTQPVAGTTLWVREPWAYLGDPKGAFDRTQMRFLATHGPLMPGTKWENPRAMQRYHARLSIRVVAVREENLQQMIDSEARSEGFENLRAYQQWWDRHHRTTWSSNPRVLVLRFTVAQQR